MKNNKIKVSKNPNKNWSNDEIQFPRLIAECEASRIFTYDVISKLMESMDLTQNQIMELIDRAQKTWDEIKNLTK